MWGYSLPLFDYHLNLESFNYFPVNSFPRLTCLSSMDGNCGATGHENNPKPGFFRKKLKKSAKNEIALLRL